MFEIAGLRICYSWRGIEFDSAGEKTLSQQSALNMFLRDVERRALRMAELSTGNREDGLEIVQEAMLGLASRYAAKPSAEWKPLFYRILQSRITDFHRRRAVRNRVMALMPWRGDEEDDVTDPIAQASYGERDNPLQELQQSAAGEAIQAAIGALPGRQQQAFMLRTWEGLSVSDTAIAMACSEGSVKTHYSRAIKALQHSLGDVER